MKIELEFVKHRTFGRCRFIIHWICWILILQIVATESRAEEPVAVAWQSASCHQLEVRRLDGGEVEFKTTGEDPYILLVPLDSGELEPEQTVLAFEYFCPEGIDGLTIYYGPPIRGNRHIHGGSLSRAESWMPHAINLASLSSGAWSRESNLLRLDFGRRNGVTVRMRNLRIRKPTDAERVTDEQNQRIRDEKLALEAKLNRFYRTRFPDQIDGVAVTVDQIHIRGTVGKTVGTEQLIEIPPEASIAKDAMFLKDRFHLRAVNGIVNVTPLPQPGDFKIAIPRFQNGRDRITSRWAIATPIDEDLVLRSCWKYATDLTKATDRDLPRAIPASVKGMSGVSQEFSLPELVDLGVHNITLNLVVDAMIDLESHPGWTLFRYRNRDWFINPALIASWDGVTEFASSHDMVTSGILLIRGNDRRASRLMVHPQFDRAGQYAMPNLTDAEGVITYEAALEFIARRYSDPRRRISNWIVHNEIGYGWQWTNMGKQPPMVYMDHYLRSMRLTHDVTRRHDPHARVFVSLTHHWNQPTDPSWRSYSNVDLLSRLCQSSQREGDFAWGVAYHPYPENLRAPDAWNDKNVTSDFQTPLITPKNIGVLDRWMHQPEMLHANGDVRGVLLSEQGFNTPDYSAANQRLQAAGLAYMWRQLRGLKSIEAFHNHRWVDHPKEGGLLLGLRKLPAGDRVWGDKKYSWRVYQALGTEDESAATAFADEIISAKNRN